MKLTIQHNDITVVTSMIDALAKSFISPFNSFNQSSVYLEQINHYLNEYLRLYEDEYRFCHPNLQYIPSLNFPDNFDLCLYLAYLKNDSFALKTLDLLNSIASFSIFDQKEFLYNNNPYYETMLEIFYITEDLVHKKNTHQQLFTILNRERNLLFPGLESQEQAVGDSEIANDNSFIDLNYFNDDCIRYLKEKIYLNLLFDFIEHPEAYKNSPYLFIDFLGNFTFNEKDTYLFCHLKIIFLRFEEQHWQVLKTLKNHVLYNLFIDVLFIQNTEYVEKPEENDSYVYYFDFISFNFLINKKVILDDLFNCMGTDNKNMRDFLYSIVKQNNYAPDNFRFDKLMILYEKQKIENKLQPRNIKSVLQKI